MLDFNQIAKLLITIGVILIGAGLLFALSAKLPWFGKLPGDIHIKKESFTFYFPLMTCLIISLILTLFFNLFKK